LYTGRRSLCSACAAFFNGLHRRRVWAKVPAVFGACVSRDRWSSRRGAREPGGRMIIPDTRFVHGKWSTLERLMVEAAHRFLGPGPCTALNEREPTRLPSVAVRRQTNGQEWADCGAVLTQFSLGHIRGKVRNKKAHCHYSLPPLAWCMDRMIAWCQIALYRPLRNAAKSADTHQTSRWRIGCTQLWETCRPSLLPIRGRGIAGGAHTPRSGVAS